MRQNPYPGKFIVFEGLDGSGQTTQAVLLAEFLRSKGKEVVLTKEPTHDSKAGTQIRRILANELACEPEELQKLFALDRGEHVEQVIIPALAQGKVVISDRYFFSSFAYGMADGLDLEWLIQLNSEFLLPDVTFLLRASPAVCMQRIDMRGTPKTLFEKQEKLELVWGAYEKLAGRFANIFVINSERPIDVIAKDVIEVVEKKLGI